MERLPKMSVPHAAMSGSVVSSEPLPIKYRTFAEARAVQRGYSDELIDQFLKPQSSVHEIINYTANTPEDVQFLDSPALISQFHANTSAMLLRNLKLNRFSAASDPSAAQARRQEIIDARTVFSNNVHASVTGVESAVTAWCQDPQKPFPLSTLNYSGDHAFSLNGKDVLENRMHDVRSNITLQRHVGGTFIMGYSDQRVQQKIDGTAAEISDRVYLNPQIMATPQVFEQLLQGANRAGVSIQLKMLNRAIEASHHRPNARYPNSLSSIRGDGIVVYASRPEIDDVLGLVLSVAQGHATAFTGRDVSRIPQRIADGIAIGSEPLVGNGTESLSGHREKMLNDVIAVVRRSGKTGSDARTLFKQMVRKSAALNKVNPDNIAFNKE